ncbi:MAG: hypothetical protein AAGH15_10660 [Myxococcota bacterium]
MSAPGPLMRARSAQEFLRFLAREEPAAISRIRARLDPQVLAEVEASIPTAWIAPPRIAEATMAELGETRLKELMRRFFPSHLEAPLLRGFAQTAQRLFGLGPETAFWVYAKGWAHMNRNAGSARVEKLGPGRARFHLEDLPASVLSDRAIILAYEGLFTGLLDAMAANGRFRYRVLPAARRVEADLEWDPAG